LLSSALRAAIAGLFAQRRRTFGATKRGTVCGPPGATNIAQYDFRTVNNASFLVDELAACIRPPDAIIRSVEYRAAPLPSNPKLILS